MSRYKFNISFERHFDFLSEANNFMNDLSKSIERDNVKSLSYRVKILDEEVQE